MVFGALSGSGNNDIYLVSAGGMPECRFFARIDRNRMMQFQSFASEPNKRLQNDAFKATRV